MITTANYYDSIKQIDWNAVPASLKKTHETLIPDASKNNWQTFNSDDDVRRVVEKYFTYVGKYVHLNDVQPATKQAAKPKRTSSQAQPSDPAQHAQARALAIALIRPYVERGETLEQIRKSYMGSSNGAGSAMVRSNKILVDKLDNVAVSYSFSLPVLYKEIKGVGKAASPQPKPKRAAKVVSDLQPPKQVISIPTATAFIKRYAALHGKVKSRDQIVSLIHGLQKAITEQRIKTGNPALREIEKMQAELLQLATTMGESAKIEIDAPSLAHYKQIAQGEEVRTSVRLLKAFISINGKAYDKAKAAALHKKMEKALETIPKEDAYLSQLSTAAKALAAYGDGKDKTIAIPSAALHGLGGMATGHGIAGLGIAPGSGEGAIIRLLREEGVKNLSESTLKKAFRKTVVPSLCLEIAHNLIHSGELTMAVLNNPSSKKKSFALAGIDNDDAAHSGRITDLDILEMRLAQHTPLANMVSGLGAVEAVPASAPIQPIVQRPQIPAPTETVSARDLAKMRFKTIGYNGRFKNVIGDPAVGFHMMVYGKPYNGKSSFVIELCKDLAALNKGKIAYLALEEGISLSMQKKVIDRGADKVDGLEFKGSMSASFDGYSFIVIDSVSDRSISREKLREMFLNNPQTCFICIFHATKEGSARGGLDYSHDMDIIIKIEDHKPFVEKNRFL